MNDECVCICRFINLLLASNRIIQGQLFLDNLNVLKNYMYAVFSRRLGKKDRYRYKLAWVYWIIYSRGVGCAIYPEARSAEGYIAQP